MSNSFIGKLSSFCEIERVRSEIYEQEAAARRLLTLALRFESIQRTLLRPRFDEVAAFLVKRHIPCQVTTNERRYDASGRLIGSVGIILRAYVDASPKDVIAKIPHYAIYWEPANAIARFYLNSNAARKAGELVHHGKAALHELTSDLVEGKLLDFARAVA